MQQQLQCTMLSTRPQPSQMAPGQRLQFAAAQLAPRAASPIAVIKQLSGLKRALLALRSSGTSEASQGTAGVARSAIQPMASFRKQGGHMMDKAGNEQKQKEDMANGARLLVGGVLACIVWGLVAALPAHALDVSHRLIHVPDILRNPLRVLISVVPIWLTIKRLNSINKEDEVDLDSMCKEDRLELIWNLLLLQVWATMAGGLLADTVLDVLFLN